jgi:hypothetical protein
MNENDILTEYFDWLIAKVYDYTNHGDSYHNLLWYLMNRVFYWPKEIPMDQNREVDGIMLRRHFEDEYGLDISCMDHMLYGHCSWLEMLVALSVRVEDQIMSDYQYGDRTGEWFWIAIKNLGLNIMTNSRFDDNYVDQCLTRFENRDYEPDGSHGGLYILQNPMPNQDMRYADIWYQVNWYLSERYRQEDTII